MHHRHANTTCAAGSSTSAAFETEDGHYSEHTKAVIDRRIREKRQNEALVKINQELDRKQREVEVLAECAYIREQREKGNPLYALPPPKKRAAKARARYGDEGEFQRLWKRDGVDGGKSSDARPGDDSGRASAGDGQELKKPPSPAPLQLRLVPGPASETAGDRQGRSSFNGLVLHEAQVKQACATGSNCARIIRTFRANLRCTFACV